MKPWHWIVPGIALSLVSPILGAMVMWPGFVMWIARRNDGDRG